MTVDMAAFEALLELVAELDSPDRVEAWLHDPTRTAHRLVSVPTAALVEEALAGQSEAAPEAEVLPARWLRLLPERALALHRGGRRDISVADYLHLTARLLEHWGWGQTGNRTRSRGQRCIKGALGALLHMGYGTEYTAHEAAAQIQGVLTKRGITMPYDLWNEQPGVTAEQAIGVVRAAAGVT